MRWVTVCFHTWFMSYAWFVFIVSQQYRWVGCAGILNFQLSTVPPPRLRAPYELTKMNARCPCDKCGLNDTRTLVHTCAHIHTHTHRETHHDTRSLSQRWLVHSSFSFIFQRARVLIEANIILDEHSLCCAMQCNRMSPPSTPLPFRCPPLQHVRRHFCCARTNKRRFVFPFKWCSSGPHACVHGSRTIHACLQIIHMHIYIRTRACIRTIVHDIWILHF
jgi:hypothetical protein